MPQVNVDKLLAEDAILEESGELHPYRFGFGHDVNYNLTNSGNWIECPDESKVWALEIICPEAYSINLIFNQFYLPKGSELYIYNSQKTILFGPVTSKQNNKAHKFSTDLIKGESIILEYTEPFYVKEQGKLEINRVVHGYKNMFSKEAEQEIYGVSNRTGESDKTEEMGIKESGSCNNDVKCSEGNGWSDEINSVALLILSGGTHNCSGSLINTTKLEPEKYLLTAYHCVDNDDPSTQTYRFKYYHSTCNGATTNYVSYSGATLKASWNGESTDTDFALLQLNYTPLGQHGLTYSGWSKSSTIADSCVGIHHPSGDVMKISLSNESPSRVIKQGIYAWEVEFYDGIVEPGSSGSPLYDWNNRVIGQLSQYVEGDQPNCSSNPDGHVLYGRLENSWIGGGSSSKRLSDWLDPDDIGSTTTNTEKIPYVTGYDLICTSPNKTFTLYNLPSGASVSWTKSSNIVEISGHDAVNYTVRASASAAGWGWVRATITRSGDSYYITYTTWAGKPDPSILGPTELECNFPEWYFIDSDSYQWGDYYWSTDYMLRILGTTTGHKARIEGLEEGYGQIFCEVTNTCGSAEERLIVSIECWGFKMSPNPADDLVTVSVKDISQGSLISKNSDTFKNEYEVTVYNSLQVKIYHLKTTEPFVQINTKNWANGVYFVHIMYEQNQIVKQLVVNH